MSAHTVITRSIEETRATCSILRGSLGLVPTMGALHDGHIALVRAAKKRCKHVAVSIFVNPKQFGANEDLDTYPRTMARDIDLLKAEGVDIIFTPDADSLYPKGFCTKVEVEGLDQMLCGISRPHFFSGVTTVVTMLFLFLRPNLAFFGEKDYQQLCIIQRLNKDLLLVDDVIGVPTVREHDGLALSSRNAYLSEDQRKTAPLLHQTLCALRDSGSEQISSSDIQQASQTLERHGFAVDYLEMRDATNLSPTQHKAHARLFVAATLGTTRLIDNIAADTQGA